MNKHDLMLVSEFEQMMRNPVKPKAITFLTVSVSIIALGVLIILRPSDSLNLITAALCGGLIGSAVERGVYLHIFRLNRRISSLKN
ncbi:hypothetical [Prochlorococcus marinus str. MIT 9313]|uniref:Uncharacterized protein n=1 Tax=Prochlorococcus marinus (strain MIT 9313) TaxID=74547 RepID=Q7V5I9_PROMM|nr:hypothetical [Prochlorococcus marinus str. MIT 9313]